MDRPRTISEFLELDRRPRIIAHRGFSGVAPENTLAAFRRAIEIGADMIELDVLSSRDGAVVVIHSIDLGTTTNGSGRVDDLDLDDLRTLDAGSWFAESFCGEHIPTLAEALDLVRNRILLNVEIKTEAVSEDTAGGIVERVLGLVSERDMLEQALISSFDTRALEHVRILDSRFTTASLYNKDVHRDMDPIEIMNAVGSSALSVSRAQIERDTVVRCHSAGRPVFVYTVNKPDRMMDLVERGVDGLFTDRPDRMLQLAHTGQFGRRCS